MASTCLELRTFLLTGLPDVAKPTGRYPTDYPTDLSLAIFGPLTGSKTLWFLGVDPVQSDMSGSTPGGATLTISRCFEPFGSTYRPLTLIRRYRPPPTRRFASPSAAQRLDWGYSCRWLAGDLRGRPPLVRGSFRGTTWNIWGSKSGPKKNFISLEFILRITTIISTC